MKPLARIALHLAVGVAAFLLVPAVIRNESPASASHTESRTRDRTRSGDTQSHAKPVVPLAVSSMKSADYRAAWDAVPAMGWDKEKRVEWQIRLLKKWAEVDLEGALAAAFAETRVRGTGVTDAETFLFHRAFADVFMDRPDAVLKLVQDRKLGILESSLLVEAWTTTLQAKDKDLYLAYIMDLRDDDFIQALGVANGDLGKESLGKLFDAVSARVAAGMSLDGVDRDLAAVAKVFSQDELLERLRSSTGEMAGLYTKMLAANYSTSSGTASGAEVTARIDSLPEDQRGPFARALLTSDTKNAELLQTALEHLVDHEQWKLLTPPETSQAMRNMREKADPVVLAEWAMTLPHRQETNEMFHRGVEPRIRKSPEEAWGWIQGIQDGYWKDRALAEYSQINLHVFNDPEKSATALGQIQDPEFLKIARAWRQGWESRQGKK
ncbi:MAG: hypothetical protein EOP88_15805 [Verrucomicrobiaceae bacterium]|nr:MAG: hypothetical protein EOP88_15805 [Verrucomicrobiaceae bacterium]